jgi:hypothetical protein
MAFFTEQQQQAIKDYCLMSGSDYLTQRVLSNSGLTTHLNFKQELRAAMNNAMHDNLKRWDT